MRSPRIDVAQMQFIGIEAVKAAYGDRWPAEKSRITAVASQHINRRISAEDLLIVGQDGFLLVFGSKRGEVAFRASQEIAESLNAFFLGEGRDTPLGFESKHSEMSLDEIAGNVEKASGIIQPPAPSVAQASANADFAAYDRVVYQPVWDARHEAVTSYYSVVVDAPSGRRVPGYQFDLPENERRNFSRTDELQLEQSEKAIHALFNQGKKALVGVSLHITSFSTDNALARMISLSSKLDARLAPYRIIKLAGVTPGYPRLNLDRIVRTLQARIPRISIGLQVNEPDISSLLSLPIFSVGFALPEHTVDGPAFASQVMPRVSAAVALAHQRGKQFFVEGPVSARKAEKLVGAGVDIISSPLIWKQCDEPDVVSRWPSTNLAKL